MICLITSSFLIVIRLEAIASRLEAPAIRLQARAIRLEAIPIWLETIAIGLEAIAIIINYVLSLPLLYFLNSSSHLALWSCHHQCWEHLASRFSGGQVSGNAP